MFCDLFNNWLINFSFFFRKELCDKLYMNIQVFVDRLYSYYNKKDKISFKKYIFDNLNWTLFIKFNKI